MDIETLLEGIELPEGVAHDRVMRVRFENDSVFAIDVVETVPPAFKGFIPCPWNYEARRGEQVVRYSSGFAAIIAVPYTITRTFVRVNGGWCAEARINSAAAAPSTPSPQAPRSGG